MPTLFAVYNLIDKDKADKYDQYLTNTKVPGIRGAPWCAGFNTWKIDKVLAPAVSEPEGELPSEAPYMYIAKIVPERKPPSLTFASMRWAKL